MAELKQASGKEERVDWIDEFDLIEETYTPGECMPPVKNEWRYRYSEYYYEVTIKKEKSILQLRSDTKPVFYGGLIGVYDKSTCNWKFYSIRQAACTTITKYVTKVRYILLGDNMYDPITKKHIIQIGYRKDDPIPISSINEWGD